MPFETTVKAVHRAASRTRAQALVLFARPGNPIPPWYAEEEPEIAVALRQLVREKELTGETGNRVIYHCFSRPHKRVIVVGVGDDPDLRGLQHAFADMVRDVREKAITRFAIVLPDYLYERSPEALAVALAEAAPISCYQFHRFMGTPDPEISLSVELITRTREQARPVKRAVDRGLALGKGVVRSRDLCNMPANVATPDYVVAQAKALAKASGGALRCTVLGEKEMKKAGMNLFRAVAQGSLGGIIVWVLGIPAALVWGGRHRGSVVLRVECGQSKMAGSG